MFPFRYSSIFRNRWIALFWAAGMCWMAVSFIPDAKPDDADNATVSVESGQPGETGVNSAEMHNLENMVAAFEK